MDEKHRLEISLQHSSNEVLQIAKNFSMDYLDYMENLPFDLQRKVTKLREVDQKCREHVTEIERLYENFIRENDGSTSIKRRSYLMKIQQLFALCKELGDEKIAIVQSISEVIEIRNKQLESGSKKFKHSYEPNVKPEHNGRKDKDSKTDAARGTKRSRRQRNTHSVEKQEKAPQIKEEKAPKLPYIDDIDEPPLKIAAPPSPEPSASVAAPTPALTRAAQRDEDKRATAKLSTKKEEKGDETETVDVVPALATKTTTEAVATAISTATTTAATSASTSTSKQSKNNGSSNNSSSSLSGKANHKGKKKKRKANKQTERQASNSGEVSPLVDMPIDPDEPTYCLCQQVSFGQMIGCDNPKCPIEWFHFSCVRLTHKPKGRWYCPDCTAKMKERKREGKRGDHR